MVIKEGTTKIGYSSIRRTNVDKIVIPESVKSIDIYTFVSCKTPLVLELNWKTKEDVDEITTKMSSFSFNGTDRSAVKVTVPKGTKSNGRVFRGCLVSGTARSAHERVFRGCLVSETARSAHGSVFQGRLVSETAHSAHGRVFRCASGRRRSAEVSLKRAVLHSRVTILD